MTPQASSSRQSPPELQEVVVSGIRQSMESALHIKQFSDTIEDSIVAFLEQTTRFLGPAFIGDTVKPRHEIVALEPKRSAGLLTLRVTLTNQRGEIILDGQHKYLVAYRP